MSVIFTIALVVAVASLAMLEVSASEAKVSVVDYAQRDLVFNRSRCVQNANSANMTLCLVCYNALSAPECPIADCPSQTEREEGTVENSKDCAYCRAATAFISKRIWETASSYCKRCKYSEELALQTLRQETNNPYAVLPFSCGSMCDQDGCARSNSSTTAKCMGAVQKYCTAL